jgi:hypothetical protein
MSKTSRRRVSPARAVAAVAVAMTVGGCGQGSGGGGPAVRADTVADPAPASAASDETTTLRLENQLSGAPRAAGGRSALLGSQLVFTGMLFKPNGSSAIGRSLGSCTRTAPGGGEVYQCLLTFILRGGSIYAQAVASADGPADGVVTGGTNRYEGMRGTFRFKATGDSRVRLTLTVRR